MVGPWQFGPANTQNLVIPWFNKVQNVIRAGQEVYPAWDGKTNRYLFINPVVRYPDPTYLPRVATFIVGGGSMTGLPPAFAFPYLNIGQNNRNPLATFYHHWIVKVGNSLYDPSYGQSFTSSANSLKNLTQLQAQEISGFWLGRPLGLSNEMFITKTGRLVFGPSVQ
jgi:hypothetical protein